MAIIQGLSLLFLQDLHRGVHNLESDTIRMALYTSSAVIGPTTEFYNTNNEVAGTGYTPGGNVVDNISFVVDAGVVIVTCDNVIWPAAPITARGALIYNASKANRAIAVFDFGSDRVGTGGDFTIIIPAPTASGGLIRYI